MTPADALATLRQAERRDGSLPIPRRQALLAALAQGMIAEATALAHAVDADFGGRDEAETLLAEVRLLADAALAARRHLPRWARPQRRGVPFPFWPASARVQLQPKGIIGIMAPWNYPLQLALWPAIDAIAAGNRIAIKPSELVPATAALLAELLPRLLGADVVQVVQGGADIAADFAAQRWDHLVFTGGSATGRKVMQAAAANLVPVTLELGGKCPAVVLPGSDLGTAARAILVGKALNAGQTCVAPDTVLLVGHDTASFAEACRRSGPHRPTTAIINDHHAARLDALCAGAALTPLGEGQGRQRAIALAQAPDTHPLLQEEIFGPVLPVVACASLQQAMDWIAARPAPLAIYLFGASRDEAVAITTATRSGAVVQERCVEFVAMPALGFGGSGGSGFGRYHGEAGFREFSTPRALVRHGRFSLSRLLDPPRGPRAQALLRRLMR